MITHKDLHEYNTNHFVTWILKANDLFKASSLIKENDNLFHAYLAVELFLLGSSVECLLKAVYLKKGNKLIEGEKFNFDLKKQHDLIEIAEKVGFELLDEEREILETLSYFNKDGRFPEPKKWDDDPLRKKNSGKDFVHFEYWDEHCDEIMKKLFERINFEFIKDYPIVKVDSTG